MEVGWKFECLQDGNFSESIPNMVCYVTHVVAEYNIGVFSAHCPYWDTSFIQWKYRL